ncbi:hypothetical protein LC087_15375 [Bacillus carboniphilus]|uniref:Uncharacterized protein n=1 Tax=Bacillus carboniphilus TaxID=86663 RepID=A0ABY9JTQ1_9BACI|nr:hypothetical protein [Bacillus carboniphilus]WLR42128.1 hypothetical protein LC087_15375 [Bacillus carboniphilus]
MGTHKLRTYDEIDEVIREEFALPKLPVKEAIDVLENLQVDVFND